MKGERTGSVYMDHSSTTRTDPRVVEAMMPYFVNVYGNPSSPHGEAVGARRAVELAREQVAGVLGCDPECVVFTSGGSESDNAAIKGTAFASLGERRHVITSAIEHHAVLHTCEYLARRFGFEITVVPVDSTGLIDPEAVAEAMRDDTALVSIMHANNEVGTIEPIADIANAAKSRGIPVHTDAVQSVGKLAFSVDGLGVDMLSLSGHKVYGPKGVGALYVRPGTRLDPVAHGGHHEGGRRAGTENVPGIVGLGVALQLAAAEIANESKRLTELSRNLENGILERVVDSKVNGHPDLRLPGVLNVGFTGIEGESIVLGLDLEGVRVSTGSACTSDETTPSHVLTAMGLSPNEAQGCVRFSLGRENTDDDVRLVLSVLPPIVDRLRAMSPLANGSRK